ncbi:MAG TPA: ankyrin repeat domain-containing protein [Pyrinomonadaceae bacterium]|jgi:hypothetical protein
MTQASPTKSTLPIDTHEWMHAVDEADTPLVKSLLAAGADVNAVGEGGQTALIRATTRGYLDIVELLLDAGADVNAKKENGATALIVAVFLGYADIVRVLLANGADPDARTPQGTTPEKWAQAIGFTEIVELLRNADAIRAAKLKAQSETAATNAQNGAPKFFPAVGTFHAVVPLSEIEETPPPVAASEATETNSHDVSVPVVAAEIDVQEAALAESDRPEQSEQEEATLVPPSHDHRSTLSTHATPPPSARPARALQSWHVIALSLVLLLVAGVALDAYWKSARRSAKVAPPVSLTPDVPAATAAAANAPVETQTAPLQPAPPQQVSDVLVSGTAANEPIVTAVTPGEIDDARDGLNSKVGRSNRTETTPNASTPFEVSESGRATTTEAAPPSSRRKLTTEARASEPSTPATREKDEAAETETVRREARPVRRTPEAEEPLQSSTSPDNSLPVFSPSPSSKAGKKKVIQWP